MSLISKNHCVDLNVRQISSVLFLQICVTSPTNVTFTALVLCRPPFSGFFCLRDMKHPRVHG